MPKIMLNGIEYASGLDEGVVDKIGTAALQTTAQDLSGAVNELKSSLDDLIKHITATAGSNITIDKSDILQIDHTVFVDAVITTSASINVNSAMITGLPSTSISNNPLTCKAVGASTTDYDVRIYAGNIYSSENIPNATQLHIYGSYNRS